MSFDLSSLTRLGGEDTSLRSLPWIGDDQGDCRCVPSFREPVGTGVDDRVVLAVDADDCPGRGDLASSPDCLSTVVEALTERDADVIRTRHRGRERTYAGRAAACLI
ncbi:MAG: type II secretion protein, partial [Halorubrum sp.]